MQERSLLPVPFREAIRDDVSATGAENDKEAARSDRMSSVTIKNKNNAIYYTVSTLLCLLAVFVTALTIFSGNNLVSDPEKIIGYIADDFLGIDINNSSIFDLWKPGGLGNDNKDSNTIDNSQGAVTENETEETSKEELSAAPQETSEQENDLYLPPVEDIPQGEYPIAETDLSSDSTEISNMTDREINIEEIIASENSSAPYVLKINHDMTLDPLVLIIHTHGTEAYSAEGSVSYSDTVNIPRSTDTEKNVIAVGKVIAEKLNENGIPAIHCEVMHDKESYQKSYERASETIKKYLKRYPSIKYVFDVHRDSIINEQKTKFRPVSSINGENVAQIMFVIGSDQNTPEHTNWKKNLTLAVKTNESINLNYEDLTRSISLRSSSYNQEYTPGSLLIEIGSCGNTLEEAKRAACIFAYEIGKIIKAGW